MTVTWLIAVTGDRMMPAWFQILAAVISLAMVGADGNRLGAATAGQLVITGAALRACSTIIAMNCRVEQAAKPLL